jgi:hypothetical protein
MKLYTPLIIEATELIPEVLTEIVLKKMVRKGKVVRRPVHRPGYKLKKVHGRYIYVRMSSSQKAKMSRIAKRSARKRKSKMRSILRKRRMSVRKRSSFSRPKHH